LKKNLRGSHFSFGQHPSFFKGVNNDYGNFAHGNNPNVAKGNRMHLGDHLELGDKKSPNFFRTSYEMTHQGG